MVLANDLQAKLGEGLSKVQGGIEQGKQRLQIVQEINRFKKLISECSLKKARILMEMGQVMYGKVRKEQTEDEDLFTMSQEMMELDKQIYTATQNIAELSNSTQKGVTCSCGVINGTNDNFCGGCGNKLEKEVEWDHSNAITCGSCENSVMNEANFCPCCGYKIH